MNKGDQKIFIYFLTFINICLVATLGMYNYATIIPGSAIMFAMAEALWRDKNGTEKV